MFSFPGISLVINMFYSNSCIKTSYHVLFSQFLLHLCTDNKHLRMFQLPICIYDQQIARVILLCNCSLLSQVKSIMTDHFWSILM